MNVEYDLVIDFARPSKSNTIIISEGDSNSRLCRFVLLSNKQSFDMLDVSTATVKGVKSDGSVIYGDGNIVKDEYGNNINEVTYTLPAAVSDVTGKTTMTITLMSVRGEIITSFEFYVQTRNSLYSEDDYISDSDLSGFRDLLNRSNAALEKMEQMTQAEALPNPYPLNIYTNTEEYHYSGNETVDVDLGDIAYLAENPTFEVDAVDETAAATAVEAAEDARTYADAARNSASVASTSKDQVTTMALDVAAQVTQASTYANNASRSAVAAGESEAEVKEIEKNINRTIENKVTTITTQLAGDMIDDIVADVTDLKDQAQASAATASQKATESTNQANRAQQIADGINVGATQILSSGTHIADLNVNGVVTELYAPAADTPATEASNITYDHTSSGLSADNIQDATDELASSVSSLDGSVSSLSSDVSGLETRVDNLKTGGSNFTINLPDYANKLFTLGTHTVTLDAEGKGEISGVMETGTLSYSCEGDNDHIDVPYYSTYVIDSLSTFDYQGWLDSASITTSFSSLDEVLADEKTLRTLFTKHASVDYLVEWSAEDTESATTILNTDLCAKWINLRDYALDTLYASTVCKSIMDSVDKYFYGEWVQVDGTWGAKGNVPIMTSNSAPYGEAISSSADSNNPNYYAFNDNVKGWCPTTSSSFGTTYIGYKFVNPINVRKVKVSFATTQYTLGWGVKIQGSNDNSTWEDVSSEFEVTTTSATIQTINNDSYYLYYRLLAVTNKTSYAVYYGNGLKLQFYGRELSVSVPTMTSNTAPWGEVTESDHHDINYGYYAFGTSNSWISAMSTTDGGEYVGFDFKNSVVPKVVAFRCSGTNRYSVGTYKIQGYKNNAWVDIDTITTPADTTLRLYPINNSNAYEKVRFLAVHSCQVGGGYYYSFVNSLNIYGLDYSEHAERHYIYDNGVEVETLAKGGSSPNVAEKTTNELRLTCASTDASIKPWFATSSSIDMSQYNLSRAIVGNEIVYGKDFMTVAQSGSGQAEDYAYMELTTSNVTCWYVDLSNENRSAYPVVKINNTSGSKLTVTEWWLE